MHELVPSVVHDSGPEQKQMLQVVPTPSLVSGTPQELRVHTSSAVVHDHRSDVCEDEVPIFSCPPCKKTFIHEVRFRQHQLSATCKDKASVDRAAVEVLLARAVQA